MEEPFDLLYNNMLAEIEAIIANEPSEIAQVEGAFIVVLSAWLRVKKELTENDFESVERKVNFYKHIKPKFAGYLEYLVFKNNALLFLTEGDSSRQLVYWKCEAEKAKPFLDEHFNFVVYYKSGATDKDLQWFLPEHDTLPICLISKVCETKPEFISSHDHLAALMIAHEMYNGYVLKKIKELE